MRGHWLAALAIGLAGCAALTKSNALEIRYFTPESEPQPGEAAAPAPAAAAPPPLRLGRVAGGPELGEEIAWRDAAEVGFYDNARWTERPEAYVARALDRALFASGRARHVLAGPAPVLDVSVLAFEEVRPQAGGPHRARVTLAVLLHDDRDALLERRFTQEVPVAGGKVEQLVQALATALQQAAAQVAEQTAAALAPH